jgi:hypothetical protein
MPRSTPTPVTASLAGTVVTLAAPDALGDILPAGDVYLLVTCGATGTTVTIQTTATVDGLDVADAGGPVAPDATRLFGPFPARLFAQPSDAAVGANQVLVDYTPSTTVTRAVLS